MVLRGLAKIASKNAQHQFTLYIRSTFILYKNMYSSNTFCIKNKKNSTKYVSHHTVSKFHRFFLSKMFMRIHFFLVLKSQNRLEESDFYQAQESSPRSHERMTMDLPTTSNISGTHMEVFIFEVLSYTLQIHVHVYYNKFLVLVNSKINLFCLSIYSHFFRSLI